MRITRRIASLSLVLCAAACGQDSGNLVAPQEPRLSEWTRTYNVWATTLTGSRFNLQPATFSGGHVDVEMVSDNPAMYPYLAGQVESNDGPYSFYKPAYNSLRLTAVPTGTGCTFRRWVVSTPTNLSTTTSSNPINMDDLHPYSNAQAEFVC